MIPPEYQAVIDHELSQTWWRVPLALIVVVSITCFVALAILDPENPEENGPEKHKSDPPQGNPEVAKPFPFFVFRCLALLCALRFAWIYFTGASDPNYNIEGHWAPEKISWVEAVCWWIYAGAIAPLWLWEEKELCCMRASGSSNAGNVLPKG